jgi:hypothetical protein
VVLKNLKIELPYELAKPPGLVNNRYLHTDIYCSTVAQVPISRWMDKENVAHTFKGVFNSTMKKKQLCHMQENG